MKYDNYRLKFELNTYFFIVTVRGRGNQPQPNHAIPIIPPDNPTISQHPLGIQEDLVAHIVENKIEIEDLIKTMRDSQSTNPHRASLGNTLEALVGKIDC